MGPRARARRFGVRRRQVRCARAAVCGNLIACAVSLTVAFPLVAGRPGDWLAVLYLGTCQLGVAYFFFTRAVPQVSALQVSLLLLLEPVLNPIWSWIVNGERPGVWTLAGGAVILSATAWKSVADGRRLAVS